MSKYIPTVVIAIAIAIIAISAIIIVGIASYIFTANNIIWAKANSVGDPSAGDCYINESLDAKRMWCLEPYKEGGGLTVMSCYRVEDIDCEEVP